MTLAIEALFGYNLIQIFGGSVVLTAMFGLAVFMMFLFLLKIPTIIILPFGLGFSAFVVANALLPEMNILIGLGVGAVVGLFIYSIWTGR